MDTIELPKWQSDLIDRYNADDFKLYNLRERKHRIMTEHLSRFSYGSSAYIQTYDYLCELTDRILTILDDMRFVKLLWNVGPIRGDIMALPIGYKGRTLFEVAEGLRDHKVVEDFDSIAHYDSFIAGMNTVLDVFRNPRNYLNKEERVGWDDAIAESRKVIRPVGVTTNHVDHAKGRKPKEPTMSDVKQGSTVTVVRRRKDA